MFPEYLTQQRRWLCRPKRHAKLPIAAFDIQPADYEPAPDEPEDAWRYKWSRPEIWATYDEALAYWHAHNDIEGLTYVVHPGDDVSSKLRVVCLDFDKAIQGGRIDETVERLLGQLDTYVELSQSGKGLHAFVLVECAPFKNVPQTPIGNCKADILCSSQIAVTGRTVGSWSTLRQVPYEFFDRLRVKEKAEHLECPDVWSDDSDLDPAKQYLVKEMLEWEPCYRSSKGCTLGAGGDTVFFSAACHLARHGVTGAAADMLLQCVPQFPAFTSEERRHKIESAYTTVQQTGEYGTYALPADIPVPTETATRTVKPAWGFTPIQVDDLIAMKLEVEFLVEGLFVDKEPLFFGGVAKSFKTSTAADLAVSLASGSPFLGRFQIFDQKVVAFFTSEIGIKPACQLFTRLARAKDLETIGSNRGNLDIIDRVPSFRQSESNARALLGLRAYLKECRVDVAVFDPLYLAMGGVSISDVNEVAETLNRITSLCREADVWPIFCHHSRKTVEQGRPMQITELTGAGIAEYARQWFLLSHATPFERGHASLYVRAGSSAGGDGNVWRLEVDEGTHERPSDRQWNVSITEGDDAPGARDQVLEALGHCGLPEGVAAIVDLSGVPRDVVVATLRALVRDGAVTAERNKYQLTERIK
jgi:hypothetical protein